MNISTWQDEEVVVLGAGRSGTAAAALLAHCGAQVTLTDLRLRHEIDPELPEGIQLKLGGHPPSLFDAAPSVVISPGIPLSAPAVRTAQSRGSRMLSEIELASSFIETDIIAITGSNGKSTVTSMTGAILAEAGFATAVCGNIGLPLSQVILDQLLGSTPIERYIVEMSSFQCETIDVFHPHFACVLNLSPDHLDRHPAFQDYVHAKLRLLRNTSMQDWVVINADDPVLQRYRPVGSAVEVLFGGPALSTVNGPACWVESNVIRWRSPDGEETALMPTMDLGVLGRHNELNACAAAALGMLAGASAANVRDALGSFQGLEHRMELCGKVAGVLCINDSKATNVEATLAAISGFERGVWLILGGQDKNADFNLLRPLLPGRVRRVLLIGEATGRIAASLRGSAPLQSCGTLERAIDEGLANAEAGEILLLAPACTSFDQYSGFEERGRCFKALIAKRNAVPSNGD